MARKSFITVRHEIPGLHCWPGAPDNRGYLRLPHRHLFRFELTIEVYHEDREIEFHDLADMLASVVCSMDQRGVARCMPDYGAMLDFGAMSCEAMASAVLDYFHLRYPREMDVRVYEDNDCYATVYEDDRA